MTKKYSFYFTKNLHIHHVIGYDISSSQAVLCNLRSIVGGMPVWPYIGEGGGGQATYFGIF